MPSELAIKIALRTSHSAQVNAVIWREVVWFVAQSLKVDVTSKRGTEEAIENLKEALELYFEEPSLPAPFFLIVA